MTNDPARISPTAHYTAYVWYANGLSVPELATPLGRTLYTALRPVNALRRASGQPDLEQMLLARHRCIDERLETEIAAGRIGQVLEIAAGLSPRGTRFCARHPGLRYVEGDLPGMVARKRAAISDRGPILLEINALEDRGLDAAATALDPAVGTALVTEGLLAYFDRESAEGMWRRFARFLGRFPRGLYLCDAHLGVYEGFAAKAFRRLLGVFARGKVHVHYADDAECVRAFQAAGFTTGRVIDPEPGRGHLVRIGEAEISEGGRR